MDKLMEQKGFVAILIGIVGYIFEVMDLLFIIFLFLLIIDYLTGVANAIKNKELSSKIGRKGILKKFGYITLVLLGFLIDLIIFYTINKIGLDLSIPEVCSFGILITLFLTSNELISIAENLTELGVPMPNFLTKFLKNFQEKMEGEKNEHK